MNDIGRMQKIQGTETVVDHYQDVAFVDDTGFRLFKDLFEISLLMLHD
jgi:hypothetical protein